MEQTVENDEFFAEVIKLVLAELAWGTKRIQGIGLVRHLRRESCTSEFEKTMRRLLSIVLQLLC